jgi:hypothetical protein
MTLTLLTSREAVLEAMREFDSLGRDAFLEKYGFGRSNSYFVQGEGDRLYDSKALAGAAVGFEHPERGPLRASEFVGGERTVRRKLEGLGFQVVVTSDDQKGCWWVNQGATFDQERAGSYLWAPQSVAGGRVLGHHTNVAHLRPGDLVLHYAKGMVRAISVVREPAREASRPAELPSESWGNDGYQAEVDYFDAPTPIALEEIPAAWRDDTAGPFTRHGGVKQGYLFPLRRSFLTRFAADFGPRWPSLLQVVGELSSEEGWAAFLGWGRRFFDWAEFDQEERDHKLQVASELGEARTALLAGNEWRERVIETFRAPNALLPWQVFDRLRKWLRDPEASADAALSALWSGEQLEERAAGFLERLPGEVVSGRGMRAAVLSYFAGAGRADEFPIYRPTPLEKAYQLIGYPAPSADANEVDVYKHALGFFDQLLDEAEEPRIALRDRLDAQGVTWCVTKSAVDEAPVNSWPRADQEAFLRYRGDLPDLPVAAGLDELASALLLDVGYLHEVERLVRDKGQLIFFGPPGTGKTYVARQLALHFAASAERITLVQFHPSYAYEDFVEGYRPQEVNGQPGFGLVPGPLKQIAEAAAEAPDELFVLIIDEINRGNVAKVFGELYFLLEYRDERIQLQYSAQEFALPQNLWLIGTMNTADRSIALLDAALRRRFYFVPFFPDQPPVEGLLRRWLRKNKPDLEWVADVVDRANSQLGDRNVAIGPSYFMRANLDEEWVHLIWQHAVIPYVAEQFFGEEDRIAEFDFERLRFGPSELEHEPPEQLPEPEQPDAPT